VQPGSQEANGFPSPPSQGRCSSALVAGASPGRLQRRAREGRGHRRS
jgi:hypothetical protein